MSHLNISQEEKKIKNWTIGLKELTYFAIQIDSSHTKNFM